MRLPALLDDHFPTHGNWQGLSLGWVSTSWLSSIVSRGAHRLVHVEPWVGRRLWTRRAPTGQAVERLDCTDDRLAIVRRCLHDDSRWSAFASALHPHTVRVYELPTAQVHVDSTRASASTTVSANGLLQFGHSQDSRPDLPHSRWWRHWRSEEHTSELQSPCNLVCRLLLEKKKKKIKTH